MLEKEPFHPIRVRDFMFTIQDKSTLVRIFKQNGDEVDLINDFDVTLPDWYISDIKIGEENGNPCIMLTAGRDLEFVIVADPRLEK